MGRPSKFSDAVFTEICVQIGSGKGLVEICRADKMPHRATVLRWIAENPALQQQYAEAHEWQADFYADQIIEISDEDAALVRLDRHYGKDKKMRNGTASDGNYIEAAFDAAAVARNKLRVDARKWKASKLAPKKWGEKVTNEHTGLDGGPVAVVTANVTPEALAEIVRNVRDKF